MNRQHYDTTLELSWAAIKHNIVYFRSKLKQSTKLMLMIKASAYGCDATLLGKKIQKEKLADYFGVATIAEGIELREAGIKLPIMVQNPNHENWNLLVKHCLEPVLYNERGINSFQKFLSSEGDNISNYPVHLEVDTGMRRFGFEEGSFDLLMEKLTKPKAWKVASVMTHLSSAGDKSSEEYTLHQLKLFDQILLKLKPYLPDKVLFHALNTDGTHNFSSYQMNMVRVGIGLYGASKVKVLRKKLIPIATFSSKVVNLRKVDKGAGISYNRSGKTKKPSNIAVLSLGYADGFPRALGNGNWEVEVNGKLYPTIGAICMDSCMINVGEDKVDIGERAIIFGKKKTIFDYAKALNTITYEALTNIGGRVQKKLVD